ncbi:hypothetical protein AB833_29150 [Chromatiales bacterium (ex Bugula neritina AB1)]|nr:hypothetical protein AB833_29150 [Chromatiales bacterium (ex Bugula neritina AB1)]
MDSTMSTKCLTEKHPLQLPSQPCTQQPGFSAEFWNYLLRMLLPGNPSRIQKQEESTAFRHTLGRSDNSTLNTVNQNPANSILPPNPTSTDAATALYTTSLKRRSRY